MLVVLQKYLFTFFYFFPLNNIVVFMMQSFALYFMQDPVELMSSAFSISAFFLWVVALVNCSTSCLERNKKHVTDVEEGRKVLYNKKTHNFNALQYSHYKRQCPSLGTSELRKGKFSESLEHEPEYSLIATFLSYYQVPCFLQLRNLNLFLYQVLLFSRFMQLKISVI